MNKPSIRPAFELRITLRELAPAVWRSVIVPHDITLVRLHGVIQTAFGWTNSHLHSFTIDGVEYGMVDDEGLADELDIVDERHRRLGDLLPRVPAEISYVYDFGDSWEHAIEVRQSVDPFSVVRCTGGANACPPEDCGGPSGYFDFLQEARDTLHREHHSTVVWVGRAFDPSAFDLDKVNRRLARVRV